ncbi:MAG: hypothetical protein KY433_04595 [Actinobacteria bacterium]|nr:hypothetical protein [Actinomycetota bacterium]
MAQYAQELSPVGHRTSAWHGSCRPPAAVRTGSGALAGIVRVHKHLDYHLLVDLMAEAEEIVILNTWIRS